MIQVLFALTLAAEILVTLCVLVSILRPRQRIWPPPRQPSWQGWLMLVLFLLSGLGNMIVGILDWGSLELTGWVRLLAGLPLWMGGVLLAQRALRTLGLSASLGGSGGFTRRGPYRFSRNPQYLGYIAGLLGWALLTGSSFTLAAGLAGILPLLLVPFAEEPWLLARYGKAYTDYCRSVRRFL